MSQWTHITGTLRVDDVLGDPYFHNFKRIFIESTFGNRNEKCNMPMGSEGSIQHSIWENPNNYSIAKYCISFFGDLRDFGSDEDIESVKEWWKRINKQVFYVRQGVLLIEVEGKKPIILKARRF